MAIEMIIRAEDDGDWRARRPAGGGWFAMARSCQRPEQEGGREATRTPGPMEWFAASLGGCLMSVLERIAARHQLDLGRSEVRVSVETVAEDRSTIRRVSTRVTLDPAAIGDPAMMRRYQAAARACPIHRSLAPEIEAPIEWSVLGEEGTSRC